MFTIIISLDNRPITLHLKHTAKKNIIVRPRDANSLTVNSPKWLPRAELMRWLNQHTTELQRCLHHTPNPQKQLETIWYRGERYAPTHPIFRLPDGLTVGQQHTHLRQFLQHAAQSTLLDTLARHSQHLHLIPTALALSNAKTFWGVCRRNTGIRLNWRLIGAPDFVQDYVCIHELCHLVHANHSPAFWQLVAQHCPNYPMAQKWLKTHGKALFALG